MTAIGVNCQTVVTVKQARKAKGLTQEQLSRLSGVDQRAISKIERGKVADVMFSTGMALADALGIDPHLLRFGVES